MSKYFLKNIEKKGSTFIRKQILIMIFVNVGYINFLKNFK